MKSSFTYVIQESDDQIVCSCGASCRNTSKERGRFLRRHPAKCSERRNVAIDLAHGTRCVDEESGAGGRIGTLPEEK